jgi:hypothetical protein
MNELLANSAGDGEEILRWAEILYLENDYRVSAEECGCRGTAGRGGCGASAERGGITAAWQINQQRVAPTFLTIVALELRAQSARLYSHDRVSPRIESDFLAEDLDADDVLLEHRPASGDGFLHHEGQKPFEAIGLAKGYAAQNSPQLVADCLAQGSYFSVRINALARGQLVQLSAQDINNLCVYSPAR